MGGIKTPVVQERLHDARSGGAIKVAVVDVGFNRQGDFHGPGACCHDQRDIDGGVGVHQGPEEGGAMAKDQGPRRIAQGNGDEMRAASSVHFASYGCFV